MAKIAPIKRFLDAVNKVTGLNATEKDSATLRQQLELLFAPGSPDALDTFKRRYIELKEYISSKPKKTIPTIRELFRLCALCFEGFHTFSSDESATEYTNLAITEYLVRWLDGATALRMNISELCAEINKRQGRYSKVTLPDDTRSLRRAYGSVGNIIHKAYMDQAKVLGFKYIKPARKEKRKNERKICYSDLFLTCASSKGYMTFCELLAKQNCSLIGGVNGDNFHFIHDALQDHNRLYEMAKSLKADDRSYVIACIALQKYEELFRFTLFAKIAAYSVNGEHSLPVDCLDDYSHFAYQALYTAYLCPVAYENAQLYSLDVPNYDKNIEIIFSQTQNYIGRLKANRDEITAFLDASYYKITDRINACLSKVKVWLAGNDKLIDWFDHIFGKLAAWIDANRDTKYDKGLNIFKKIAPDLNELFCIRTFDRQLFTLAFAMLLNVYDPKKLSRIKWTGKMFKQAADFFKTEYPIVESYTDITFDNNMQLSQHSYCAFANLYVYHKDSFEQLYSYATVKIRSRKKSKRKMRAAPRWKS